MAEPGAPEPTQSLMETLRQNSSEDQRQTAAELAEGFEYTIFYLMHRSGDDPDLVQAARDFVRAFESRTISPNNEEPFSPQDKARLTAFLRETADRLGANVEVPLK